MDEINWLPFAITHPLSNRFVLSFYVYVPKCKMFSSISNISIFIDSTGVNRGTCITFLDIFFFWWGIFWTPRPFMNKIHFHPYLFFLEKKRTVNILDKRKKRLTLFDQKWQLNVSDSVIANISDKAALK